MKHAITALAALGAVVLAFHLSGCAEVPEGDPPVEEKPLSYAEALSIYNQELQALDRLQSQKSELQKQLKPQPLDLLSGVLDQATELRTEVRDTLEDLGDPSGVFADNESNKKTDDLLAHVGQQLKEASQGSDEKKKEIEAKIAELDEQIAKQEKRVERATADRDAAQAAR